MRAFTPGAKTVNIDVAASSANIAVGSDNGIQQIRVMNNGTATAWIAFGTDSTIAATVAGSIPVGPGVVEVFSLPGPVFAAAIAAGSTGKIYFTPGQGL